MEMITRSCQVMVRVVSNNHYIYVHPAVAPNGRIRPGYALVRGKIEAHPEAVYVVRYFENRKVRYLPAGNKLDVALAIKRRQEIKPAAEDAGLLVKPDLNSTRTLLSDACAKWHVRMKVHRSHRRQLDYALVLPKFQASCGRKYLDEITADDLLKFMAEMKEEGLGDRTIANRISMLNALLNRYGIAKLLRPEDRPRFDKKLPVHYDIAELTRFLNACQPDDRLLFETFVMTGLREKELAHCEWADIDFNGGVLKVCSKPSRNFRVKDREEREIPLPATLLAALKKRKDTSKSRLVWPNFHGKPHTHRLRKLKKIAFDQGLNCGLCVGRTGLRCSESASCQKFGLHKFRKSYATLMHQSGVDARMLQHLLGHASITTTMEYLGVGDSRSPRMRTMIDAAWGSIGIAG